MKKFKINESLFTKEADNYVTNTDCHVFHGYKCCLKGFPMVWDSRACSDCQKSATSYRMKKGDQ